MYNSYTVDAFIENSVARRKEEKNKNSISLNLLNTSTISHRDLQSHLAQMQAINNPGIYMTVSAIPSIDSFHFCPGLSKAGLPDPNSYPKSGTMPEDTFWTVQWK